MRGKMLPQEEDSFSFHVGDKLPIDLAFRKYVRRWDTTSPMNENWNRW